MKNLNGIGKSKTDKTVTADHDSASLNGRRPGVEWVSRDDCGNPRNELGNDAGIDEMNEDNLGSFVVVDPNDVQVALHVEGKVVPKRLCFLKICGFVVCDDTFPYLLNSNIFIFLLVALVIAGACIVGIFAKKDFSNTDFQNVGNIQPIDVMDEDASETVDPRIIKITQAVFEISGNMTLEVNSSQNKALNWIIYEDDMKLAHNSSNLIQRYLMMVFFYNLSGENWFEKGGYGTGKHECEWYGIKCSERSYASEQIEGIDLHHNFLRGKIPDEITFLPRLAGLQLSNNAITGKIPKYIGELRALRTLNLEHNRLTGTIPANILNCRNIASISLYSNMISGSIPEFSGEHWSLSKIKLNRNKLSGTIPTTIGSLNSLMLLNLSLNLLTGSIPPELGKAYNLYHFEARENFLTDEIPSSIGNIPDLKRLALSHNRLSGVVPTSIYKHAKIQELILNGNRLTGTIPSLFDILPSAKAIILSENMINGTIPENIGDIPKLEGLKLHFSMLTGEVPQTVCNLKLQFLTADCAGKDPKVICSCCTTCF